MAARRDDLDRLSQLDEPLDLAFEDDMRLARELGDQVADG
jgi:hypothetical protein